MDSFKIWLVRTTPKWALRLLWKLRIVERETVFRWEMNVAIGEWDLVHPGSEKGS